MHHFIEGMVHVQITVPVGAEEQASEFYLGVLGMVEVEKPTSLKQRGGFWAKAGRSMLHVGVEDHVDRMATKAHVAWRVTNLAESLTHLHKHGVRVQESIPIPGYVRLEFRDPFGHRVELIQALDATPSP